MKTLLAAILLAASILFATPPLAVAAGASMGEADARHLLNRTGFGATPAEVAAYARLSREEGVRQRLAGFSGRPQVTPPEVAFEPLHRARQLGEEEKKAALRAEFQKGAEIRAWWLQEMLQTPSPLSERMTLFWHNHFVSSQQKVKPARLMLDQNLLLRRHALGNFGVLLHAVARDPAMLVYLDGATSRRGQPNENFAREVMELFTLGEGHYAEQDIKEAARAFTGWSVDRETGTYLWRPQAHDDGEKSVLGRQGRFDGDAVLDILLAQPACAEFIAGKLWREFVSPQPEPKELAHVAVRLRETGYDIRAALAALLSTRAFWAPENRGVLVKSPVDLVVGSARTLDIRVPDALPLAFTVRNLGQDLFAPPNVKGWPGGDAWINASTLLARKAFIERLLRNERLVAPMARADGVEMDYEQGSRQQRQRVRDLREEFGKGAGRLEGDGRLRMAQALSDIRFDSAAWLAGFPDHAAVARALSPVVPVVPPAADLQGLALVRTLALDPAYQLK